MRRPNDFYPTPGWATHELLRHVDVGGAVLECCAGDLAIAANLPERCSVMTNDIDTARNCHMSFDASKPWPLVKGAVDWVITNPPFAFAPAIVPLAYEHATIGIAMLLRLSYLEPVENRGAWLNEHPPTELIVLPRISFTGDGKTDNVTCAWFVWDKQSTGQKIVIAENPKFKTAPALTREEADLVIGAIPLQALPR